MFLARAEPRENLHETGNSDAAGVRRSIGVLRSLDAETVSLLPGTTKNRQGRTFKFTADLRRLFEAQRKAADQAQREHDCVVPWVFFRLDSTLAINPKTGKLAWYFQHLTFWLGLRASGGETQIKPVTHGPKRTERPT